MTSGKQVDSEMQLTERTTAGWCRRLAILCLLLAATAITLPAQTFTSLFSFDYNNGAFPDAALAQGPDGNLYGTANSGGANSGGTVFQMTPTGTLTTFYSFCAQTNCTDGASPTAGLVLGTDGNFYGTTSEGGSYNNSVICNDNGCGTVFRITPAGTLTTLYSFCSLTNCVDGTAPQAGLIQAIDGNFYGITDEGGSYGYGTVFKITSNGTLTTLYSFCSLTTCDDGAYPVAPLVQARDGNFYGTTVGGGAYSTGFCDGCGTVFKMTPQGTVTTLYSFCAESNCADGANPFAGLIQATDGDLYGATFYGGSGCQIGCGTLFKITPAGKLTTLHRFDVTDGAWPSVPLIQAVDGNLYGITEEGGAGTACGTKVGCGTVFKSTLVLLR